jgi:hypothetical protein
MATTKKSSPVKKKPNAKGKAVARPLTWKFYTVAIGIFLIAVTTVVVIALLASSYVANQQTQARLDRINAIYTSLSMGEAYKVQRVNVFGDKRVYNWDAGRTYSSEIDYTRGASVSSTVTELDTKIKAAGFTFVGEPYPGSTNVQYHYKSSKGEYIRLTVSSKPRDDALKNAYLMDKNAAPESATTMDTNAGPSNVIIKVNLDDNNE